MPWTKCFSKTFQNFLSAFLTWNCIWKARKGDQLNPKQLIMLLFSVIYWIGSFKSDEPSRIGDFKIHLINRGLSSMWKNHTQPQQPSTSSSTLVTSLVTPCFRHASHSWTSTCKSASVVMLVTRTRTASWSDVFSEAEVRTADRPCDAMQFQVLEVVSEKPCSVESHLDISLDRDYL